MDAVCATHAAFLHRMLSKGSIDWGLLDEKILDRFNLGTTGKPAFADLFHLMRLEILYSFEERDFDLEKISYLRGLGVIPKALEDDPDFAILKRLHSPVETHFSELGRTLLFFKNYFDTADQKANNTDLTTYEHVKEYFAYHYLNQMEYLAPHLMQKVFDKEWRKNSNSWKSLMNIMVNEDSATPPPILGLVDKQKPMAKILPFKPRGGPIPS